MLKLGRLSLRVVFELSLLYSTILIAQALKARQVKVIFIRDFKHDIRFTLLYSNFDLLTLIFNQKLIYH